MSNRQLPCTVTPETDYLEVLDHRSDVVQININEDDTVMSVQLSYDSVNELIYDLECWKESHNGTGKFK